MGCYKCLLVSVQVNQTMLLCDGNTVITVATSVCNIGSDQRLCNADCLERRRIIDTGWYLDMLHISECSGRVIAIIFEPLDGLSDDDRFEFTIALWKKIGTTTHFEKVSHKLLHKNNTFILRLVTPSVTQYNTHCSIFWKW